MRYLWIFILVSALSCRGDESNSSQFAECVSDTDCPREHGCHLASQRCIAFATEIPDLEIQPPKNNQGWMVQEFTGLAAPGGTRPFTLKLSSVVSLQGRAYASDDKQQLGIPSQLVAWRASAIEGRPRIQTAFATHVGSQTQSAGQFALWLAHHRAYQVFVTPYDGYEDRYPPILWNTNTDDHILRDFVFEGPTHSIEIRGIVRDAANKALPFGVSVRGFDEEFGVPSTVGETCSVKTVHRCSCASDACNTDATSLECQSSLLPCLGEFSFRIPAGLKRYTIRIEPRTDVSAETESPKIPSITCEGALLGVVTHRENEPAIQSLPAPILMPLFEFPKERSFTVVGTQGDAVDGANVTFTTLVGMGAQKGFSTCRALYQQNKTTDDKGTLTVPLLPVGRAGIPYYTVDVVPPETSVYASTTLGTPCSLADKTSPCGISFLEIPDVIDLQPRLSLEGTVFDDQLRPLAGAKMEVRGVQPEGDGPVPIGTATTTTNSGRFVLRMDPGRYHVRIVPPRRSGSPIFGKTITIEVDNSCRIEDEEENCFRFVAPKPKLLVGNLVTVDGKPASEFTVQAFDILDNGRETKKAFPKSTAITDEQGAFRLILAE